MKKLLGLILFGGLCSVGNTQSQSDFYLVNHTQKTISKVYLACHNQSGDWMEARLASGGSIDPGDAQYVAIDPNEPCYTVDLRVDYDDDTYAEFMDGLNLHTTRAITITHQGGSTYITITH